ncbi:hypothetical protein G5714_022471 [Onychostoma macrolepis]|uniref:Death domain-containing protein n=1 Tax=Onychostoma macrolepis TaxID=369639 RepID=A0A7J6BS64_9TELE|nr:hypothetical protein G5714_022471 [Onychostoma macrolepis]
MSSQIYLFISTAHISLSSRDQQAPCRSALKDWLQIHGKQIYYDRLSRALQKIGRTDIAIVAEDIGPHQLERLVELLTAHECEELISAISQPEESIFQHLDRLSAERNQLLHSRRRRNTGKYDRHKSHCFK